MPLRFLKRWLARPNQVYVAVEMGHKPGTEYALVLFASLDRDDLIAAVERYIEVTGAVAEWMNLGSPEGWEREYVRRDLTATLVVGPKALLPAE